MDERRSDQRHRALRGAKIVFNDRRSVIDCTVRNLSGTGARLQVESVSGIPPVFDLLIDGQNRYQRCRLTWQTDRCLGISFDQRSGRS